MLFNSPIFLFLFLPAVLACYYLCGPRFRNLILLLASLLFYFWSEIEYTLLMLFCILSNHILGYFIEKYRTQAKKILLAALFVNVLLLAVFKYSAFFTLNLNTVLSYLGLALLPIVKTHLPIGVSFFTLQAMTYVFDVYRKEAHPQKNPLNLALFISLFPQLMAGPILRYRDVEGQILKRNHTISDFSYGVRRFIMGLGKKVLIADTLAVVVDRIFMIPASELTTGLSWLGITCFAIQIYYDFSGYSDMAVGLGRMFGFRFMENFNYPYISQSLREFWRRWHISLATWFRDYVYIPLGGSRCSRTRNLLNLLIVFILCGLWHGAEWKFILWGLYNGGFILLEHMGFDRLLLRFPRMFRHLYVVSVLIFGYVLFRSPTIDAAISYADVMLGLSGYGTFYYLSGFYLTKKVVLALIVGAVGSTPMASHMWQRIKSSCDSFGWLCSPLFRVSICAFRLMFMVSVLLLSVISLAAYTSNPFIYFRF